MKHKYKLGDYVEYYASYFRNSNNKIEYTDMQQGFVNSIEDRMEEDGSVVVRYMIGRYIGASGYIVREEAIARKLKAPKYKSRLDYLKVKVKNNEWRIKTLDDETKSLQKEIAKLEKVQVNGQSSQKERANE